MVDQILINIESRIGGLSGQLKRLIDEVGIDNQKITFDFVTVSLHVNKMLLAFSSTLVTNIAGFTT